jgi:hypothetical protein
MKVIKEGDKQQLQYIRDRYNYLLEAKFELQDFIAGLKRRNKKITLDVQKLLDIQTELLYIDYCRTGYVLHGSAIHLHAMTDDFKRSPEEAINYVGLTKDKSIAA